LPSSYDRTELSPGGRIAIGAACVALGIGLAVMGVATIRDDPRPLASDGIPGTAAGAVFALGGALLATPTSATRLRTLFATLLVTSMAIATDWIAFGPGTRHFSESLSRSGNGPSFPVSEWKGRAVFGLGAVLLDALAGLLWYLQLRPGKRAGGRG